MEHSQIHRHVTTAISEQGTSFLPYSQVDRHLMEVCRLNECMTRMSPSLVCGNIWNPFLKWWSSLHSFPSMLWGFLKLWLILVGLVDLIYIFWSRVSSLPLSDFTKCIHFLQDAYRLQLKLFLYEVRQQQLLSGVRTFLKVYSTISLVKLANYMEVDEPTLRYFILDSVLVKSVSFLYVVVTEN